MSTVQGITIPTREPLELRAGDIWEWRREDLAQNFPASFWLLQYGFKNETSHWEVESVPDGDFFFLQVPTTVTEIVDPGDYKWGAWVQEFPFAGHRHTVGSGQITILPSFLGTGIFDARSTARQIRDSLYEALKTFASTNGRVTMYQIGDRQMQFSTSGDIMKELNFWEARVKSEEAADRLEQGLSGARRLLARL